jgi:hypothetical protein
MPIPVRPREMFSFLERRSELTRHSPLIQYRELFDESPAIRSCLQWMYCDVMDFHIGAFRFFFGPGTFNSLAESYPDISVKDGSGDFARTGKILRSNSMAF